MANLISVVLILGLAACSSLPEYHPAASDTSRSAMTADIPPAVTQRVDKPAPWSNLGWLCRDSYVERLPDFRARCLDNNDHCDKAPWYQKEECRFQLNSKCAVAEPNAKEKKIITQLKKELDLCLKQKVE